MLDRWGGNKMYRHQTGRKSLRRLAVLAGGRQQRLEHRSKIIGRNLRYRRPPGRACTVAVDLGQIGNAAGIRDVASILSADPPLQRIQLLLGVRDAFITQRTSALTLRATTTFFNEPTSTRFFLRLSRIAATRPFSSPICRACKVHCENPSFARGPQCPELRILPNSLTRPPIGRIRAATWPGPSVSLAPQG